MFFKQTSAMIALLFLVSVKTSFAASFSGTTSQAMGGTGRGAIIPTEVAFLNPASFASARGYFIATAYRDFSVYDGTNEKNFVAHLSENSPGSMFPLAITYMRTSFPNLATEDIHLTSAQAIAKNLALGIDVARYKVRPTGGPDDAEWDLKVGLMYATTDSLGVGLVFSNFLSTDNPALKKQIEAGVNYRFDEFFRAAFDIIYPTEDNTSDEGVVMLGLEHYLKKQFPIRAGFKWDDLNNENYWTFGLGWNGPRIGFDYSYEKNASRGGEYGHSVDLRIYF